MLLLHGGVLLASTRQPEPVMAVQCLHHLFWGPHHPVWLLCQARKQEEESNVWNEMLWSILAYSDLSFNVSIWLKSTLVSVLHRRAVGGLLALRVSQNMDLTPLLLSCLLLLVKKQFNRLALLQTLLNISCFVSCWWYVVLIAVICHKFYLSNTYSAFFLV